VTTKNDSPTSDEAFDCVEFKRRAQARIHEDIEGMTHEQEIAYFHRRANEGWMGEWWRSIQREASAVHERPPDRDGARD
jgi:hypothetical protein